MRNLLINKSIKLQSLSTLMLFCVFAISSLSGLSYAETVSVDLTVLPDSTVEAEVAASAKVLFSTISASDSATTTVTGNVLADLDIYFDDAAPENTTIDTVTFTGGTLLFSDASFTLDFGFAGQLNASATGLGGTTGSPFGPDFVIDDMFDSANHTLTFNQGQLHAAGTGLVGAAFDPVTYNLTEEQLELSLSTTAIIYVELDSMDGSLATYNVSLSLPVIYEQRIYDDGTVTVSLLGSGSVEIQGSFTRQTCPFIDLSGDDCYIDSSDFAVFADQWLASGNPDDCPLTADLFGDDCYVDFADFTVIALEWLVE